MRVEMRFRIQRLQWVGAAIAAVACLTLAGTSISSSMTDYRRSQLGGKEFARFQAVLMAATSISAERGPANSLMGATDAQKPAFAAALAAKRAETDAFIERVDAELATLAGENLVELGIANAAVVTGPLPAGYPSEGPYDVVLLGGAVELVPDALFEQLKEGGRLVGAVGYGPAAQAMLFTRTGGDIGRRPVFNVHLRPLPGFNKPKAFVF